MFQLTVKNLSDPAKEHSIVISDEDAKSIARFIVNRVIPMAFEAGGNYINNPIRVTIVRCPDASEQKSSEETCEIKGTEDIKKIS